MTERIHLHKDPVEGDVLQWRLVDGRYRFTAFALPPSTPTTPAGSTGYIQFNSGGVFAADSDFSWDGSTNTLAVGSVATPGVIRAPNGSGAQNGAGLTVRTGDSGDSSHNGGDLTISAGDGGSGLSTVGGNILIKAGDATNSTSGSVGSITLRGGINANTVVADLVIGADDFHYTINGNIDVFCYMENQGTGASAEAKFGVVNNSFQGVGFGSTCTGFSTGNLWSGSPSGQFGYIQFDQSLYVFSPGTTPTFRLDTSRNFIGLGGYATGQSATAPAILDNGTITTASIGVARVAPAAARTGIILQSGTIDGQVVTVINESTTLNSLTFAVSGTSHVSNGVTSVIAGLTARRFVWDSSTSLWYPCI